MTSVLDRFELHARGTNVSRELRGALATFLTMAYILFVNPQILSGATGMTPTVIASLTACTALAAGVCSILMGWFSNFPIALAAGMGLNAVVAYTIAAPKNAGGWQAAMGLIVLDGLLTLVLVLVGLREAIMNAIPRDLRLAIGAGIGLFIAFIGLVNGGVVVGSGLPDAPLKPGDWHNPGTALCLVGLAITAVLVARKVHAALIVGILLTTILSQSHQWLICVTVLLITVGLATFLRKIGGIVALILLIVVIIIALRNPTITFTRPSFAAAFHADVRGALQWKLLPLLFSVIMVDFFDTLGTASAIAEEGGLVDKQGRVTGIRSILLIDSISAAIGGLLGASSNTCYIESAAGVAEGARTGLHSIFVGILFLLAIFLAPIAGVVPAAATAPALILVGYLMIAQVAKIDYAKPDTAIPAFITLLTIPLTYSIAHGIGYGFIAFTAIKLLSGRWKEGHWLMYATSGAFVVQFLFERM